MEIDKLTRREACLYQVGAFDMLLSVYRNDEQKQEIIRHMVLDIIHGYLPEYDENMIMELTEICFKEKSQGIARKIVKNDLQDGEMNE